MKSVSALSMASRWFEVSASLGDAGPTVFRVALRGPRLDIFRAMAEDLVGLDLDRVRMRVGHAPIDAEATAPLGIEHEDAEGVVSREPFAERVGAG